MKTKIVAIGGGNGLSTLLKGLIEYSFDISAIVSVFDSGGSTGILRKEFDIPAIGDIRRAVSALSKNKRLAELFEHRFDNGEVNGHKFGNLFILALYKRYKSFKKAVAKSSEIMQTSGKVFPVSLDYADLVAKLDNGKIVTGETNIDIPKHDGNSKIKKIFLSKSCEASLEAITAIKNADYILIGPGDLYTSVLVNFLPEGIVRSLRNSRAKKIYICNIKTKFGETNNFTVNDFVQTIEDYLYPKVLDYVVYNNKTMGDDFVEFNGREFNKYINIKFIGSDLVSKSNPQDHDSKKIAQTIKGIIDVQK